MIDHPLRQMIQRNKLLRDMEVRGFIRGDEKGKTMDVDPYTMMQSVRKQIGDLEAAWAVYYLGFPAYRQQQRMELQQKLADLRSVCGCLFIRLEHERGGR